MGVAVMARMTNGWVFVLVLIAVLGACILVYAAIVCWPQRIPKDQSVNGIRERIEDEERQKRRCDRG
ncbi:hypothetical protein ACQPW1_21620 [Nocardia sp. CA-128927]|uniref:hypothetical protein n=1 Tax=Nocardia sp. CA-128927 TaxID=3239975 RepID=UPI003D99DEA5